MNTNDNLAKLWRAIIEFDMLQPEDRILIGFSGGKDSMFLVAQLAELQKHAPFHFDLACITVNTMFVSEFPTERYQSFCQQYGLEWYSEDINVPKLQKDNSPCYSCAYFRRAVINRRAKELGFNKVALAHHHDDAVETFFMNILTSGQLKTFRPVTELSRSSITVLRPLIYYREKEIIEQTDKLHFQPIKNPCPYDGNTTRQEIKKQISDLSIKYPELYEHLAAAMRQQDGMELWPAKIEKQKIIDKFHSFWKDKK
ncbi:MAG: tRNA lysidine(34) synthetase TilS [Acidaminococcaceae bacterium]|nr:tRNA lysidine(34) synthetase TilS [Acidaminococcaceae bacterium]MDO4936032.1 tRNA lysidine(34) synthetase TilS [Phascolarctobacterium sp.]